MIEVESTSARIGGQTLFYQVAGRGPAVVLLHGLSGSTRWWRKNVEPLAAHFRVYAVDLIGFGRSRRQPFSLERSGETLAQWMDAVGEERFHVVGHSMGGLISVDLAARHPERLDRLVLVDALALPMGHGIARSALALVEALRWLPGDFLPVLVADALRAGPLTLARASWAIHQADRSAALRRIAARVLIVWGEHDTLLPAPQGAALHAALPGSEFVVIEGAGHNPMWDRPAEFNRLLTRFLREGEAAG
jgi:pimeloyl-ACP methyl ester carboxylesterase